MKKTNLRKVREKTCTRCGYRTTHADEAICPKCGRILRYVTEKNKKNVPLYD